MVKPTRPGQSFSSGTSSKEAKTAEAKNTEGGVKKRGRKAKKVNFSQAQQVYLKVRQEKEEERQKEREERLKRSEAIEKDNKSRKNMNQALKKKTKKGQPNLNAQIEVLLERIQRKDAKK